MEKYWETNKKEIRIIGYYETKKKTNYEIKPNAQFNNSARKMKKRQIS